MLSLSLKNNLRKRKSLLLTAEPLVRDEKQIVWKYSWNVQSMLCITVVKTSVREYDFCLLSHGTRMKGEGSTGTLCMLKNNQNKKKNPFFQAQIKLYIPQDSRLFLH